jgi:hypothetical protein
MADEQQAGKAIRIIKLVDVEATYVSPLLELRVAFVRAVV